MTIRIIQQNDKIVVLSNMVEAEIKGKPASLQPKNKWHGYNNITLKLNKFKSIKMTTAKTADPPAKPD